MKPNPIVILATLLTLGPTALPGCSDSIDEDSDAERTIACVKEKLAINGGEAEQDLRCWIKFNYKHAEEKRLLIECMSQAKDHAGISDCKIESMERYEALYQPYDECIVEGGCLAQDVQCNDACHPTEVDCGPCHDACNAKMGECASWYDAVCSQQCTDRWRTCHPDSFMGTDYDWESIAKCDETAFECQNACLC